MADQQFVHNKSVESSTKSAADAKKALLKLIEQTPDEKFEKANSLFSSFRGGHVTLIM